MRAGGKVEEGKVQKCKPGSEKQLGGLGPLGSPLRVRGRGLLTSYPAGTPPPAPLCPTGGGREGSCEL